MNISSVYQLIKSLIWNHEIVHIIRFIYRLFGNLSRYQLNFVARIKQRQFLLISTIMAECEDSGKKITVTVKTPKNKKDITVEENATIKEVCLNLNLGLMYCSSVELEQKKRCKHRCGRVPYCHDCALCACLHACHVVNATLQKAYAWLYIVYSL